MADFVTQISSLDGKTTSNTESLTDFDSTIPQILTFYNDFTLLEKPTKIWLKEVTGGFVLGRSDLAVLGQDKLGFVGGFALFDVSHFDNAVFDKDAPIHIKYIVPPNGVFVEDLRTYSFIDKQASTGTFTEGKWIGNTGDVLLATDIYYNEQAPKTKVTFDFSKVNHNLDFTQDKLYISTDGGNTWIDISSILTYESSFTRLSYKIVAGKDNTYIECVDNNSKELKVYYAIFE